MYRLYILQCISDRIQESGEKRYYYWHIVWEWRGDLKKVTSTKKRKKIWFYPSNKKCIWFWKTIIETHIFVFNNHLEIALPQRTAWFWATFAWMIYDIHELGNYISFSKPGIQHQLHVKWRFMIYKTYLIMQRYMNCLMCAVYNSQDR